MGGAAQTNAELLREGYRRFNEGDLEWVFGQISPEIVWEDASEMPDARVYRGPAEVRSFLESFGRHWEELRFEPEELTEAGDSVLVFARVVGRGRSSGAEVDAQVAHLFELRDGRVTRVRTFFDRVQAREALDRPRG
jgi:ketosteroid isomerase-like protein